MGNDGPRELTTRLVRLLILLTIPAFGFTPEVVEPTFVSSFEPREFSQSLVYSGPNPILGVGNLDLKFGMSENPAWQLGLSTEGKFSSSLLFSRTPGAAGGPFRNDEMGMQRLDAGFSWSTNGLDLALRRDTARLLTSNRGLTRQSVSLATNGFSYERTRTDIAGVINPFILKNYGLQERLGSASSGYVKTDGLVGLTDTFEKLGYSLGKLSVQQHSRILKQEQEKLHDFSQSLSYDGFSFLRTVRSVTKGFRPLEQLGYQSFTGLRGGRSEEMTAAYRNDTVAVSWNQNIVTLPTTSTRATNYVLAVKPSDSSSINLAHRTLVTKSGENISKQTRDQLGVAFATGKHRFTGRAELLSTNKTFDWELGYRHDRTKITLQETTTEAPSWFRKLNIETASGVSYLTEKRSDSSYELLRIIQTPVEALTVKAEYERWRNASSPRYVSSPHGLLNSQKATGLFLQASYQPNDLGVSVSYKTLLRESESLSELSAGLVKNLGTGLNLKADWYLTHVDDRRTRERRELYLQYDAGNPLIPLAEVGLKQVALDKESTFSPFLRLKLLPYESLSFEAALAQTAIEQAKTRNALDYSKHQNEAFSFNATQSIDDGWVKFGYNTQPNPDLTLSRTVSLQAQSPSYLGAVATGSWRSDAKDTYQAGLAWKNGGHDLTVNYWLQIDGTSSSKLDLDYSTDLGDHKLSISGYWNERKTDKWYVGFSYKGIGN